MKHEPKRMEEKELFSSSRDAAEAAAAAAKNAGRATWEDAARRMSRGIQHWSELIADETKGDDCK